LLYDWYKQEVKTLSAEILVNIPVSFVELESRGCLDAALFAAVQQKVDTKYLLHTVDDRGFRANVNVTKVIRFLQAGANGAFIGKNGSANVERVSFGDHQNFQHESLAKRICKRRLHPVSKRFEGQVFTRMSSHTDQVFITTKESLLRRHFLPGLGGMSEFFLFCAPALQVQLDTVQESIARWRNISGLRFPPRYKHMFKPGDEDWGYWRYGGPTAGKYTFHA